VKLYLAGPMRGYPEFNFPAFDEAAARLRTLGHEIISPAEMDRAIGFDEKAGKLPDGFVEEAMRRDLEAIQSVEAIALLPGWQRSEGVRKEIAEARRLRLPLYEYRPLLRMALAHIPYDDASEVRTVSATGGAKGVKRARFDLIPAGPLTAVATHYGIGAEKYDDRNWERGYEWSKSFGAMMRHAWAFWSGEDTDAETGSPHLAAVCFHALALLEFADTHPDFDDRP